MNRAIAIITTIILVAVFGTVAYATEPTEAEMQAFQSAMSLYEQSQALAKVTFDPVTGDEVIEEPTPEQRKHDAIIAFQSFITTYPASELAPVVQNYVGKCYFELEDSTNAKAEFNNLVSNYPSSDLVDDALYMVAFINYTDSDYDNALTAFEALIADYEGNANEELTDKVPFAYFMVGECHRKLDDMNKARAKWNELITKFPKHSQADRAKKRLSQ